jgi:hypothetical protein
MAPKRGFAIPPDNRETPRRERKEIKRLSDEQPGITREPRVKKETQVELRRKAAEGRLSEGTFEERCGAVIDLMMLRPDSYWFDQPVPVEIVPDYLDVISTPCDYLTVRQRLDGGQYADEFAFAADMRLIFTNAVTCAPPATAMRSACSRLGSLIPFCPSSVRVREDRAAALPLTAEVAMPMVGAQLQLEAGSRLPQVGGRLLARLRALLCPLPRPRGSAARWCAAFRRHNRLWEGIFEAQAQDADGTAERGRIGRERR